tara:strand:+ start:818 stop:1855 length:1038 start_codon:yes stop_codon:yes gene_type:complete
MYKTIETSKSILRIHPKNLLKEHEYLFERDLQFLLPNCELNTLYDYNLNNDGYLWKFFSFHRETYRNRTRKSLGKFRKLKFFLKNIFEKKTTLQTGIWLIDSWSNNYFHWFGDVLYKFHLANYTNKDLLIIIPMEYIEIPFVKESLKMLNINYHILLKDKSYQVKNLFIVSESYGLNYKKKYVSQVSGNWHKDPLVRLRNSFYKASNTGCKKIYISRKNAENRKITNEQELILILEEYDFEIYDFDNISWINQIEICRKANFVVSINGAALTNMIFMNKDSTVLEVRHPLGGEQNCFYSMCDVFNFSYFYFLGIPTSNDVHKSDLFVKTKDFRLLLNNIINNKFK